MAIIMLPPDVENETTVTTLAATSNNINANNNQNQAPLLGIAVADAASLYLNLVGVVVWFHKTWDIMRQPAIKDHLSITNIG